MTDELEFYIRREKISAGHWRIFINGDHVGDAKRCARTAHLPDWWEFNHREYHLLSDCEESAFWLWREQNQEPEPRPPTLTAEERKRAFEGRFTGKSGTARLRKITDPMSIYKRNA